MELQILKTLKYKTIFSTPLDFIEVYTEIFRNVLGSNGSGVNPQILFQIKVKNNINNVMYITNTTSQMAYLCFIQALNQANLINLINMKQFEKNFFSFNYQFSNVF